MFLQVIHDIQTHVVATEEYSLEFVKQGIFLFVFIRFWRKDELCRVFLKRSGLVLGQGSAELCLVSFVLAAFSTRPNLISSSGCSLETIQATDGSSYSKHGLQRPLRFNDFSIARLMQKKSYSIFKRIDCHSVLQNLIAFLSGSLDLYWTVLTRVLAKVCFVVVCLVNFA